MSGDLINQPELYESSVILEAKKDRLRVATGELVAGKDYDKILVTYPTAPVEVFTYTLSAATVRVVTVTYTNATKADLLSVEVS